MPIGTLRIVPFPHPPHPPDGARYVGGVLLPAEEDNGGATSSADPKITGAQDNSRKSDENSPPRNISNDNNNNSAAAEPLRHRALSLVDQRRLSAPLPFGADRQTDFHDGKEPYVKLGRVAVLPDFRGHQVALQLWTVAKKWLQEHPTYFNPSVKELGMDLMQVGNAGDIPKWNGLVCIHSQEHVAKIYERWGFKVDKGMGKFYEEGIPHVGMFQRLEVKGTDPKI